LKPTPGKQFARPYLEKTLHTHTQNAAGVAEVVKHLTSKCEALSSDPSIAKKKKKTTDFFPRWNLTMLLRLA
jgi:hypothetical protein